MKPAAEPDYPLAALAGGDAGAAAERAWNDLTLIWGRGEHGKVVRLCDWAVSVGAQFGQPLPAGHCAGR